MTLWAMVWRVPSSGQALRLAMLLASSVASLCFAQPARQLTQGVVAEDVTPGADAAPVPEGTASADTPSDALVTRFEASIEFDKRVASSRFNDALPVGERMVQLTEEEFGKTSTQTADAYSHLADAERRAGVHDAAEKNFLHAIDVYRAVDGPFTPLAIESLTGLGDNYGDDRQPLKAVSAYSEARQVNRRAYGLLNENQIPLLDRLSQSFLAMNQPVEAEQRQIEAMRLVARSWPPESDQGLAAIYRYAAWLGQLGRFQEERDQYMRAVRIIRDAYGRTDPRLVDPLVGIGNSFRNQHLGGSEGAGSLRDALDLLTAQPNPDKLRLAEVLRDVGDWEVAFSKVGYGGAEYLRAWELLGEIDDGDRLREAWFKKPVFVIKEPYSERYLSFDEHDPPGYVIVRFDIDKTGEAQNVAVVESDPPGFKDDAFVRHIRRSRFRLQVENGEIVRADGVAMRFTYRYDPEALKKNDDARTKQEDQHVKPQK